MDGQNSRNLDKLVDRGGATKSGPNPLAVGFHSVTRDNRDRTLSGRILPADIPAGRDRSKNGGIPTRSSGSVPEFALPLGQVA